MSKRRRVRRYDLCRPDGWIWTCAWWRKGLRESCWRRSGWTRDRRLHLLHLLPLLRKLEWKSAIHGDDARRCREMQPWARGRGRSRHRRRRARGPGRRGGCFRRKASCWWEMLRRWRARGCAERVAMLRDAGAGMKRVLSAATTAWRCAAESPETTACWAALALVVSRRSSCASCQGGGSQAGTQMVQKCWCGRWG